MVDLSKFSAAVARHPYPLLFATVSGAHLYGFPSPDSDVDLRGAHLLPLHELLGLKAGPETIDVMEHENGIELDLVTHDAKKFFRLLQKPNGYVLEQLMSPLVVLSTTEHSELVSLAPRLVTRRHAGHYMGFARNEWSLFAREQPRRIKRLLYVYRVLLTGIHLLRSGEVNADLAELNADFRLPEVDSLIAEKRNGQEKMSLPADEIEFHRGQYESLTAMLQVAETASQLPDTPSAADALHDILIRLRLRDRPSEQR